MFRLSVLSLALAAQLCGEGEAYRKWALDGGARTAEQAQAEEAEIAAKPQDFRKRVELLAYYHTVEQRRPEVAEARKAHLLWLIDKQPDSDVWLEPLVEEHDPAAYATVRDRWRQEVTAHPNRVRRLRNAAAFLLVQDRAQARDLLAQALTAGTKLSGVERLQARADALSILDIKKLDLYGLPAPRQGPATPSAEAQAVLEQAKASTSGSRLCETGNALLEYGAGSLAGDDPQHDVVNLAYVFFSTGISIDSWAEACRSGAETIAAWQSLRAAGWLPTKAERDAGTKLAVAKGRLNERRIMTAYPVFPAFAKSHGITGPVLARLKLNRDGSVAQAEVLSGAKELADSALTAFRGWKFVVPVYGEQAAEVVTVMELRYTLN